MNDIPIRETSVVLKKQLIDLVNEIIALKKSNPNNEEYKENFTNAYNKLKQFNEEYDKKSKTGRKKIT